MFKKKRFLWWSLFCFIIFFIGCMSFDKSGGAFPGESSSEEMEKITSHKDLSPSSEKKEYEPSDAEIPAVDTSTRERSSTTASSSSGLKAGFSDDNKQFNYFVNFLQEYKSVEHLPIKTSERIHFKIKDKTGKSLHNADISIFNLSNRLLCSGKTYSDGSFLFFPSEYGDDQTFYAEVSYLQQEQTFDFDRNGKRSIEVQLDYNRPDITNIPLDILFIMDTTGSMGEEINRLKTTIEIINLNLMSLSSQPLVRFGMVLYKDRGDETYNTQVIPLTENLEKFQKELNEVYADGGGDQPEDLQAALEDSIKKVSWNTDGIRLAFIITDAPPHLDYIDQEFTYVDAVQAARTRGIKFFSVGTGGLDIAGEYVLRQIAQYTYAKYIFLTYGEKGENSGGAAGSVSHHTGSNWQTDKLESIIIRFTKEELNYLTNQVPEEGEEYFEAIKITEEKNEETLKKLFDMAIEQLIDYSSINISRGTTATMLPLSIVDERDKVNAEYFSDQLLGSLAGNPILKMVERKNIQTILNELNLQMSGLVNDESAVKIGALLGAELLITGNVYRKSKNFEVFLKLLRVETSEILGVTRAKIVIDLGLK